MSLNNKTFLFIQPFLSFMGKGIEIRKLSIDELTEAILPDVKQVLDSAYFNSLVYPHLLEDLKEKHEFFRAHLAYQGFNLVGLAVIEDKVHPHMDYEGHKPVHLKRFTVHPDHRRKGIGKMLLDEAKKYVFDELKLPVMFVESNEAGALSFYGREGALFSTRAISKYFPGNSPQDSIRLFCRYITDPSFRKLRFKEDEGVPFVFYGTAEVEKQYQNLGYLSKQGLLKLKRRLSLPVKIEKQIVDDAYQEPPPNLKTEHKVCSDVFTLEQVQKVMTLFPGEKDICGAEPSALMTSPLEADSIFNARFINE